MFNLGEELIKLDIKNKKVNQNKEEWQNPIPFNRFSNLPDFPSQVLPSPWKEMVEAVAEVNQVDKGLPGSLYLAVLSTCLAKKGKVDLITHIEPLNIFVCAIADPGERKSCTIRLMTNPVYEYQKTKEIEMQDEIKKAYNKYKIDEQRLIHLQKQAAKADNEIERRKLQTEAFELNKIITENPVPKSPVYIADDITSEAIGVVMADNNERLSVISTEGGIFGIMAGRYNERGGANFDIYLKGHAGDPWSSHRIGREVKTMLSPTLTMCLTVQPDVINEIGKNKQFRGRGLLARFLYSLNKSQAGLRTRQKKCVPETVLTQYNNHIKALMNIPLELKPLKLTPEAQDLWDEFYNDIEVDMQTDKPMEALKDWGSKLSGAVARIAGLLHFAEHGIHAGDKPISVDIVGASAAIGAYYREHALAVFGLMQEDPRIEAAKKILEYIELHRPDIFIR
jgi:hypothetical protein